MSVDESRTPTLSPRGTRSRPVGGEPAGSASVKGWRPGRPRIGDVSADDIRHARFRTVGQGYEPRDVDELLDQVEATLRRWEQRPAPRPQTRAQAPLAGWPFSRPAAAAPAATTHPAPVAGPVPAAEPPAIRMMTESGLTRVVGGPGYAESEVDSFLEHAALALELLEQGVTPEMTPGMVEQVLFRATWEAGYDQQEVDELLDQVARALRRGPTRGSRRTDGRPTTW